MRKRNGNWATRVGRDTVLAVGLVAVAAPCQGQVVLQPGEIPFTLQSADIRRFVPPIRLGLRERAVQYNEALVLTIVASRADMDSLPPSMEPRLYIGQFEYGIFEVRGLGDDSLQLVVHVRDWQDLAERAPMILTIEHGAPIRSPERFVRPGLIRFTRDVVRDRRE